MKKEEFRELAKSRVLFLDGATGSNLMKAGMPAGVCPEQWILEHEDIMENLQREYVRAGSDILYAPTFTANRIKLEEYGLADRIEEINTKLVSLSKRAAEGKALVAGDLTMTGRQLAPMGDMGFEELIDIYKEQIRYLADAGADLLVVETMMSLQESRAALIAAKETCELPVMVTMTFEKDGRSLFGTDAVSAAVTLESLGADAIGANCSTGPAQMESILKSMASAVSVPLIAKPNAGLPAVDADGNTVYDMDADTFAEEMKILADAGATILGGCCGTAPLYIEKLTESVNKNSGITEETEGRMQGFHKKGRHFLSSQCMTLEFGLDDPFMIVGERINPTGKKKLQEQLRNGEFELVKQFAEEQEKNGAAVLDVNMGMSGIDEKEMMLKAIEETVSVTNLPLSLDSSHVDVLEQALRHYPGRALVNSVSLEKEKFERLLPIVKKYGAMFILLPLSDKGLPETLEEKIQIIETIAAKALALGMSKEDIVVDGLVATVGANEKAALETLQTIRFCKEKGLATICGLSNISFGLPERSYVNTAFLTMAIREGLTMAIANPSQELLVCSAFASDLLLNKEGGDIRYIEYMSGVTERKEKERMEELKLSAAPLSGDAVKRAQKGAGDITGDTKETPKVDDQDAGWHEKIKTAVLKGNKKGIAGVTQSALEDGEKPQEILNAVLLPAINEVGELFDKGKYFLPQLIASAEAMKNAIEVLEPLLMSEHEKKDMPTVVIATVEGDIHDIGKNLVALMLKNYGFQVIDLGKDVPKEKIIQAAKENRAQIIALSALMTTTMQQMRHVVEYAKEQGVNAKIMIGGAVITQDYADEIGADGYSKDAAEAVKLAQRLVQRLVKAD